MLYTHTHTHTHTHIAFVVHGFIGAYIYGAHTYIYMHTYTQIKVIIIYITSFCRIAVRGAEGY